MLGTINLLPMLVGTDKERRVICESYTTEFLILDIPSPYKAIIGKPAQLQFHIQFDVRWLMIVFVTLVKDATIFVD